MSISTQQLMNELDDRFKEISMHDLEEIRSRASEAIKQRFVRPKKCKRGKLSPYITKTKWEILLRSEHNYKFRFCYYLMRKLALRVGEVVEINISNLNLENKELFIITEKSRMPDICYLDDEVYTKLKEWILENIDEIKAHQGYVFFPTKHSNSKRNFISKNTVRNHFRASCEKSHLQTSYGTAYNQNRVLNLFTTHSCRHSGITDFYIKTHDLVLTQKFARHISIKSTIVYIHHTEDDMRNAINNPTYNWTDEDKKDINIMLLEFRRSESYKKNNIISI